VLKEIWIEIPQTAQPDEREELFTAASEACATIVEGNSASRLGGKQGIAVLEHAGPGEIESIKREGKKIALKVAIKGKEDENAAVEAAELGPDYLVVDCRDWRVIPLENIIAKTRGKTKLIAQVQNAEEAQLVLKTLELGTDGVLLKTADPDEIAKTAALVRKENARILLTTARVTTIKQIGTGARVCVDTCDLMQQGEGILVGSQSAGLFLVEAEVHENPYVASRPFRVNAGSLPLYTLASMENTRYLSELKAGDEVLIVDRQGNARTTNVGRAKIEFRPLMLIEAEADGKKITAILQNAETIRLVTPAGSKPVTELKVGDEVVVHVAAPGGRHFGISVPEEKVIER
jgi:3-dehydroquinate synthase II